MPPAHSRRQLLRLAGAAMATGLAGCSQAGGSSAPPSVTPAPVPTAAPTPEATPTPAGPTPAPDDMGFEVTVLSGFTAESPARLEIAFWNAGERRLTALDGPTYLLPFVDDDNAAPGPSGEPALTLVPDDAGRSLVREGRARAGELLPGTSTDGCWSGEFEWPENLGTSALTLQAVSLGPGDRRTHRYSLLFVGECAPGQYRFVNTFDLAAGDPPREAGLVRVWLGFDVGVSDTLGVRVVVHEPTIGTPAGDG